ncbi:MAG: hypothetical protein NZ853_08755 [Leptospiraceae bacterium]|nr:hypothetical protein [Leptospiraceae bacterium]
MKKIFIKILQSDIVRSSNWFTSLGISVLNSNINNTRHEIKTILEHLKKGNSKLKVFMESILLQLDLDQTLKDDPLKWRLQAAFSKDDLVFPKKVKEKNRQSPKTNLRFSNSN